MANIYRRYFSTQHIDKNIVFCIQISLKIVLVDPSDMK